MRAARTGNDQAFERLYTRYLRRIAAYVDGMVHDHARAEDITQDVFFSALRRMRETDTPIAFKPWIYEIAKNACIDAFRRSKRAEEISYDADGELGDHDGRLMHRGPLPEAAVDQKLSLDHLRGAFGGLSDSHHRILVMRELEGLSYREIGERLGMSRASVESTLFRARRRLTEEYEELVSGERCRKVAGILAANAPGSLGARDERRVSRHLSWCQPCRRHATMAGYDVAALARKPLRAKVAAWLPLPAFLRRRWLRGGHSEGAQSAITGHTGTLAQLTNTAAACADPAMSGWMKAAAVATTMAIAGVGAGVASHDVGIPGAGSATDRGAPRSPAAHAEHPRAAAGSRRVSAGSATGGASHASGARGSSSRGGSSGGSSSGSGGATASAGSGASSAGGGSASPVTQATSGATKTVSGTTKIASGATSALKPVTDTVRHVLSPSGSSSSSSGSTTSGGSGPVSSVTGAVGQVTQPVTQTLGQAGQSLPVVGSPTQPAAAAPSPPPSDGGLVGGTLDGVKDTTGKLLGGG